MRTGKVFLNIVKRPDIMHAQPLNYLYNKPTKSRLLVLFLLILLCSAVTAQHYNQKKNKIKLAAEITDLATTSDRFAVTDGRLLKILDYEGNVRYQYSIKEGSIYAITFLPANELLLGVTEYKATPRKRFVIKQLDAYGMLKHEFIDTTLTQELADELFRNNTVGASNAIAFIRPSVLHLGGTKELKPPQVEEKLSHVEIIQSLAVSPDGTRIASLDKYNLLKVWDAEGRILKQFHINNNRLRTSVYFLPDSRIFLEPSIILNAQDTSIQTIPGVEEYSAIVANEKIYFYIDKPGGKPEKLYNLATGEFKELPGAAVYTVWGSASKDQIALLGSDGIIRVLDETGEIKSTFGQVKEEKITVRKQEITRYSKINVICQSPDGRHIVSGDELGKVIIWKLE